MSKREINIQGAIFEYNGSNNTIERINSTDRIEEELTLQVNVYFFFISLNIFYMVIVFITLCHAQFYWKTVIILSQLRFCV